MSQSCYKNRSFQLSPLVCNDDEKILYCFPCLVVSDLSMALITFSCQTVTDLSTFILSNPMKLGLNSVIFESNSELKESHEILRTSASS